MIRFVGHSTFHFGCYIIRIELFQLHQAIKSPEKTVEDCWLCLE